MTAVETPRYKVALRRIRRAARREDSHLSIQRIDEEQTLLGSGRCYGCKEGSPEWERSSDPMIRVIEDNRDRSNRTIGYLFHQSCYDSLVKSKS